MYSFIYSYISSHATQRGRTMGYVNVKTEIYSNRSKQGRECQYVCLTPKTNSLRSAEIRRIRTGAAGRSTARGYRLTVYISALVRARKQSNRFKYLPQIFIGASNSRSTGCCMKISLERTHSHRISLSVRFTWK